MMPEDYSYEEVDFWKQNLEIKRGDDEDEYHTEAN